MGPETSVTAFADNLWCLVIPKHLQNRASGHELAGRVHTEWKTMCARAQLSHEKIVTKKNQPWKPAAALKGMGLVDAQPQASTAAQS